ncbi:MAG: NUDIX domain-containing protein, partial [Candidatus Methanospirareceae archaeon]
MRRNPVLTVDVVIKKDEGYVFIKRKKEPYKGWWAIPGGIVEYGETVEEAARREAKEETGLDVRLIKLIGVYSDPSRDP